MYAQTDRGFSVAHVVDEMVVPECLDLRTGAIACRTDKVHHFRCALAWPGPADCLQALGPAMRIGGSYCLMPQH